MPWLEKSLVRVRRRIEAACARSGREPGEVRLVGVTKGVPSGAVAAAVRAGLKDLGENYVQELEAKRDAVPDATWHFVGRIQRNKVRRVLRLADVIQTVEPGPASDRLAELAGVEGRTAEFLVEVDFTGRRVGAGPEEVGAFVTRLVEDHHLPVRGLMTVAPAEGDPRPWFARLRELRDEVAVIATGVTELSMGMSADLEAAVEEGATMVRVGTAIFGPRPR